jgi:hypothetical protein
MLTFTRREVVRQQPQMDIVDQPPVNVTEETPMATSSGDGYQPVDYRSECED